MLKTEADLGAAIMRSMRDGRTGIGTSRHDSGPSSACRVELGTQS